MENNFVKLLYATPLRFISNGIRYSRDNHYLSDTKIARKYCIEKDNDTCYCDRVIGEKDYALIKKVGMHLHHDSVLEFGNIIYDVKVPLKILVEIERHRQGLSMTIQGSWFTIDKSNIHFVKSRDEKVNARLEQLKQDIYNLIDEYKELNGNDKLTKQQREDVVLLLPNAFVYKGQMQFNIRSLLHFLTLRTSNAAYYLIQEFAYELFEVLPDDYKGIILEDKNIAKNIDRIKEKKQGELL